MDDEPWPGVAEVQFTDTAGRRRSLFDKAPIFAAMGEFVTVPTSVHGAATLDGLEEFTMRPGQLTR
ncbi:hypothetical protein OHV05_36505 (plasmid) [Kitasatospora sp. NBC_00070]|uniref:hypothetical protein n=1 Tax=Kitasatospora sp. NBC_00070 TaxID=2975962 RepID=UPI003245342F